MTYFPAAERPNSTVASVPAGGVLILLVGERPTYINRADFLAGFGGAVVTPPPVVSGVPLTGLTFVQPSAAPPDAGFGVILGHLAPTGGIGPYSYAMGTDAVSTKYRLIDPTGQRTPEEAGFIQIYFGPVGSAAESITVTCTDGLGASITKAMPLAKRAATGTAGYMFFAEQCLNTANVAGNPYFQQTWKGWAFGGDHSSKDTQGFTDPSGLFTVAYSNLSAPYNKPPIPPGTYPVTVTSTSATETLSLAVTIVISAVPVIGPIFFTPRVVSTSQTAGVLVGRALATTQTNGRLWTVTGPDAFYFSIDPKTGDVTIRVTPPLGTVNISLTCTDRLAVVTQAYAIPVVAGIVLPPSNMTLVPAAGLDNYVRGQVIGTPVVTGLSGTPAWSFRYIERYVSGYLPVPLFQIDAATGLTTAPGQLSNWTYALTYAATDGVRTCTQTFNVPVAWVANAPTLYAGAGMKAAHGATGFEHLVEVLDLFKNANLGANAGATVIIAPNADPNYYAEDNGNGLNGTTLSTLRSLQNGWQGPVRLQSASATGARPRVGGTVNPASGSGGYDIGNKGFFNLGNGDIVISGLEISFVNGYGTDNIHAMSGIRKNGDTYGDLTVTNCFIHDCDNGILAGAGPFRLFLDSNEFSNCGTAYDGGGATHGCYIGQCVELRYTNNLAHRCTNGHNLKTRARVGTVTGNRMYDGERGSASTQLEMPAAGAYTVRNNSFHKGPNAQQAGSIQYGAEYGIYAGAQNWQTNTLLIDANTFFMDTPPYNHFGQCTAIRHYGVISLIDGTQSAVTATNNSFFNSADASVINETHATGHTATASISGSTVLALPPALDLSHPGTASPAGARVGFLNYVKDNANTYVNFDQVQIDPGNDDLRLRLNAAVGTVVMQCSAYGANVWKRTSATDIRINPFVSGTVFSISQDPQWYQGSLASPWALVGRYAIAGSTGVVTAAAPRGTFGVDFLKIRATAPNGTLCDYRFAISVALETYAQFALAVACRETLGTFDYVGRTPNYQAQNTSGPPALGAYQFDKNSLIATGYYTNDGNLTGFAWVDANFTGLDGITTKQAFLNSPTIQTKASNAWYAAVGWPEVQRLNLQSYRGQTRGGIFITSAALLGGMTLVSAAQLQQFLSTNGVTDPADGLGTPVSQYVRGLSGFVTPFDAGPTG